jgi:hypothetical protein
MGAMTINYRTVIQCSPSYGRREKTSSSARLPSPKVAERLHSIGLIESLPSNDTIWKSLMLWVASQPLNAQPVDAKGVLTCLCLA